MPDEKRRALVIALVSITQKQHLKRLVNLHGEITNVIFAQVIRLQPGLARKRALLWKLDIKGALCCGKRGHGDVPFLSKFPKLESNGFFSRLWAAIENRANDLGSFAGDRFLRQQANAYYADIIDWS